MAPSWISPFAKQDFCGIPLTKSLYSLGILFSLGILKCFVTFGVSLNMMGQGLVVGYTAILLPQLRTEGSEIFVDETTGSWIGSIVSFAIIAANLLGSMVLTMFMGRKAINLLSLVPMFLGWTCIYFATSVTWLLVARLLQGMSIGFSASVGPILIGEYTSPRNRGSFLTTVSIGTALGNFSSHTMGMFLSWRTTGLAIAIICIFNMLIIIMSPESPCWLINEGRYDEGRKLFRYLRGDDEDEELEAMISANIELRKSEQGQKMTVTDRFKSNLTYFKETIVKKEFYKPIFIMAHIYAIGQWGGGNIMSAFTLDVFNGVITPPFDPTLILLSMDVHRTTVNSISVFVIRKVKRRTILLFTVGIAVLDFFVIAAYSYAKACNVLPFDHPAIGIFLTHLLTFTIAAGSVPTVYIIAGELFPLEYRSIAGGISIFFFSFHVGVCIKTGSYLFNHVGIPGTFTIYGVILFYCLGIIWKFLPETKDRTLQDIEDEFRGIKRIKEGKSLNNIDVGEIGK